MRALRFDEIPYRRLLRISDVLKIDGQRLHYLFFAIAQFEVALVAQIADRDEKKNRSLTLDRPSSAPLSPDGFADNVFQDVNALGLSGCVPAARRLRDYFKQNPYTPPERIEVIRDLVRDVRVSLYDALENPALLAIELRHARYFEPDAPLFGQKVFDAFEDAREEIEEAGKCIAVGRHKACVFHLMLAMETALRELGAKLGATLINKHGKPLTWLVINNNIKGKIEALPTGGDKVRLERVSAMLDSVGNAWRNPTMHPAGHYDDMQAETVFNAVKGFMREVADVL